MHPALALHAALFTMVLRSTRASLLVPPLVLELVIAPAWTFWLLAERTPYAYMPFATQPSLSRSRRRRMGVSGLRAQADAGRDIGREQSAALARRREWRSLSAFILGAAGARGSVVPGHRVVRPHHLLRARRARIDFRRSLARRRSLAWGWSRARVLRRLQGDRADVHDRCRRTPRGRAHPRRRLPRGGGVLVSQALATARLEQRSR